jgi:hypothetical protein
MQGGLVLGVLLNEGMAQQKSAMHGVQMLLYFPSVKTMKWVCDSGAAQHCVWSFVLRHVPGPVSSQIPAAIERLSWDLYQLFGEMLQL